MFIPCKDVSTQNTADDVPQVRDVVDIGQSAGDKDVSFTWNREAEHRGKRGRWGISEKGQ